MKLQNVYRNMTIICWIGLAILLFGSFSPALFPERTATIILFFCLPIGFLVIIAGAIYGNLNLRCPHCDKVLRFKGSKPNFCPACGEKLEW